MIGTLSPVGPNKVTFCIMHPRPFLYVVREGESARGAHAYERDARAALSYSESFLLMTRRSDAFCATGEREG